ncbi:hypothetical protein CCYA_CCYA09G2583 [Cyanidiococcus yangmingshanensis]|nr:hypothetical protein CCYA_CCYA09G2583 [Cyanidiococcus yangmingshanensis]
MNRSAADLPTRSRERNKLFSTVLPGQWGPRYRVRRPAWKRYLTTVLFLVVTTVLLWALLRRPLSSNYHEFFRARKQATRKDILRSIWVGDEESLPRGAHQEYFRCVRSLARLIYLCRLVDNPHQLFGRDPPTTLEECELQERSVFERCSRTRLAPTRSVARLTARALRSIPFFIAATAPAVQTPSLESTQTSELGVKAGEPLTSSAITLVTHISLSKLPELHRLAQVWKGPISCSLFVRNLSQVPFVLDRFPSGRSDRIDIHLLVADQYERMTHYPFNAARNLALDNARTDWVFLVDVDFLPNPELADNVVHTLERYPKLRDDMERRRAVLVVPAFEKLQTPSSATDPLPASRAALLEEARAGRIVPFHVSWYWPGHGPTDFMRWLGVSGEDATEKWDEPYWVRYSEGYEPYMVAYRHGLPRYEDIFVGYGWNKQSFVKELHYAGYEMYVLRDCFIVHINHEYSAMRNQQKQENLQHVNSTKAYHEQLLRARYGKRQLSIPVEKLS